MIDPFITLKKNIYKQNSHTQTARPGTTTSSPYKYLFRAGIEPATRSVAVNRSAAAPTMPC